MKQKIAILSIFAILFISLTAGIMNDTGRAGATGAPGETTCNTTNCHNSFALNSGAGSVSATSTMNNWTYDPMTTYTISYKVARNGSLVFGIGTEILNTAGASSGTWTITDPVHTRIKTRTIGANIRSNMVHTLNGGLFNDSATFTCNWTSPDTTAGVLTMYFAGNAGNHSGTAAGDYIYTSSITIHPASGNKVNDIASADPFTISPNPANSFINLHYTLPKNETVEVKMYDLKGSVLYTLSKSDSRVGENNERIALPTDCKSGLYLISLESSTGNVYRKIFVN